MWLKSVQLENIKGFKHTGTIEFSKGLNVLVGPNNSGKTTILKSIYLSQQLPTNNRNFNTLDVFFNRNTRIGAESSEIQLEIAQCEFDRLNFQGEIAAGTVENLKFLFQDIQKRRQAAFERGTGNFVLKQLPFFHQSEPRNFIYPYFSRRKPDEFNEQVGVFPLQTVEEVFTNLYAKVDRISNPHIEEFQDWERVCRNTLGFSISCAPSSNGKQAGLIVNRSTHIPLDSMGEGTINILGLLAHLCAANQNLFLIEEIENDIHPKALKSVLEFIIQKSSENQFIISTHSNIVLRYLGAQADCKVFSISMERDNAKIPLSTINVVSDKPEDRIRLLENLGYDLYDFNLWKGYLILEESTAERVIRDFLIPHFYPSLVTRLRTIAASGFQDVEPRILDFLRLFVFVHSAPAYKQRAWVAVDGDENGQKLVADLKTKFQRDWPESHFRCFNQKSFEKYYPEKFKAKVEAVLQLPHGKEKQKAKGELAVEVVNWALANPDEAKKDFQKSAKELLEFLKELEAKLT